MGIKTKRGKPSFPLLSIVYRFSKIPFVSKKRKFRLFLDLEWIFNRLSHECSFEYYEPTSHPFRISTKEFLWKHINESHRVLDLGCNNGVLSCIIAEKCKHLTGIDMDEKFLSYAEKNNKRPNITYIKGDAVEYLRNNDVKYDVLILSHILEHLDEPQLFLTNCAGYFSHLYIEFPDFESTYLNEYRKRLGNQLIYTDDDHVFEWSRNEAMQMFGNCNLEVIDCEFRYGMQRYWLQSK